MPLLSDSFLAVVFALGFALWKYKQDHTPTHLLLVLPLLFLFLLFHIRRRTRNSILLRQHTQQAVFIILFFVVFVFPNILSPLNLVVLEVENSKFGSLARRDAPPVEIYFGLLPPKTEASQRFVAKYLCMFSLIPPLVKLKLPKSTSLTNTGFATFPSTDPASLPSPTPTPLQTFHLIPSSRTVLAKKHNINLLISIPSDLKIPVPPTIICGRISGNPPKFALEDSFKVRYQHLRPVVFEMQKCPISTENIPTHQALLVTILVPYMLLVLLAIKIFDIFDPKNDRESNERENGNGNENGSESETELVDQSGDKTHVD